MEVLREKNTATTITIPLVSVASGDFEDTPVSFAAGDVKVRKDDGSFTNITSLPTHVSGGAYAVALTADEMNADQVQVLLKDQGTKVFEDVMIVINTVPLTLLRALHHRFFGKHEKNLDTGIDTFYETDGATELMQRERTDTEVAGERIATWDAP